MDNHDHNDHDGLNLGLLVGMVLLARHDNNRPEWEAIAWGAVIGVVMGLAVIAFVLLGN
jgi:hypothetical protein